MKKLFVLLVVFSIAFASKSEAKPSSFTLTIKFGEHGSCTGFGICSIIISFKQAGSYSNADSEQMAVSGEIRNNMLVISLPKEINDKGRNAQGKYAVSISKEMVLEQELAKSLGAEKLVIAPGHYELQGNTLTLKIVSPRDPATGQSSGKRVLPTVNKKDITIDESGVH